MKHALTVCGISMLAFAAAGAQVASHVPTVLRQTPAQNSVVTATPPPNKTVALVNGSALTGEDLLREEYAIFPYARQHNGLPKEFAAQIHDGAMKMLVFEELVYQEALRRKMTVPAAKMQRAEAAFRKQFPSPDQFNSFLQTEFHGSQRLLDDKIRRSLLIEAFLKTEVESRSAPSAAEVKAWYEKNPARFEHPETYTFQTISVLPPANPTADQLKEGRKRAEQALRQARQTKTAEEFGMLAEKISDDDYRVVMGQHKPVPVDRLAPPVVKALRAMHVGQVSDLIQLDQAYTVVRLGAHTPAGKSSYQEVRVELTKELQKKKLNDLRAALDQDLRRKAKIEEF